MRAEAHLGSMSATSHGHMQEKPQFQQGAAKLFDKKMTNGALPNGSSGYDDFRAKF